MSSVIVSGDTSGSITLSAPAVSGSSVLTLPVATDTLVGKATTDTLTNKSIVATQLTGTIAAARLPAGSVLQVVGATRTTFSSTTSTSYVTSNLSAAITPTSSSSKILIIFHAHCAKNGDSGIWLSLKRGASQISEFIANAFFEFNGNYGGSSCSIAYLDSPATTSSTTYEIFFKSQTGTSSAQMFVNNAMGTITLMEIAA